MSSSSTIFPSTSQSLLTDKNPTSNHGWKKTHKRSTLYQKKSKKGSAFEEAIDAIKNIASQPILIPQYSERSDHPAQDAIDHFTAYVGAKLREMSPQCRKLSEQEIMKVLFAASEDNKR